MPEEIEEQEPQETPEEEEETSEETPDEEQETSEKPEEEKETPEKPEPSQKEKKLYARLQKEKTKRLRAEQKSRAFEREEKPKPNSQEEKKSAEKEAEEYLTRLMDKVLDKRDQKKLEAEKKEDDAYQEMLDNFAELDEGFDDKKFGQLVKKYKPGDEDAAWQLWQDFKEGKKPEAKPKPKLPTGKKTTDEERTTKYDTKKDGKKPLWEILSRAKKEQGITD